MKSGMAPMRMAARLLCGVSIGASFAWSVTAAAQDTAEESSQVEEVQSGDAIVVTGSRLRGTAPVGSPLISFGADDIASSGAVTIDRALKEIPQVFDLGTSENSRAQAGGNSNISYGNSINLRGIGPYATLILIDGHRAASNARAVDPSVLPSLGVERIEIVADGASAIYGSDAIAGVVNLIPRRNLDGFEAVARGGISDDGNFHEYQFGIAGGKRWSTGQVMVAYEHAYRSNLQGSDRDFFIADQRELGGPDYSITRCSPGTITAGGVTYAIPQGGVTQATAGQLVPGTVNRCNDIVGQDLIPEQKYHSVNATLTQEITPDITFFADGYFSKREFARDWSIFNATLNVPETNAFFVRPAGFTGSTYQIGYSFADDLPSDTASGHAQVWQITPGVRVNLPGDWRFEGLFTHGRTDDFANQYRGLNNAALNAALASSDPATAFDPYGLGRTSDAVLANISNQIFFAPTKTRFTGYEARLDGALVSLPGGDVKLAVGYERQEIDVELGSARGAPTTPMAWRYFDRDVNSLYAEVLLPLFGSGNAVGGLERLELTAAVRYDNYSDVGDTTNPKFGINWSPLPGLTFRGSYGTSFRAPLISQIYGNSTALFVQSYQDPTGGPPISGVAYSGANPDLKPEEATTWTAGFDWRAAPGLDLSMTYFDVNYVNQVESYLSDVALLNREDLFDGTGLILRGTDARDRTIELLNAGIPLVRGSFPGGNVQNVTLFIDGRNQNLGRSITRGLDFTARYRMETDNAGAFTFGVNGTYILDYKVAVSEAAPFVDRLNRIFQPLRFKARASVNWELEPFTARLQATHVGGYTNDAIATIQEVGSYTVLDLNLGWTIFSNSDGRDITLGLEARNLLNTKPPYVNLAPGPNGSGGYDATVANPIGRLFGASVRANW